MRGAASGANSRLSSYIYETSGARRKSLSEIFKRSREPGLKKGCEILKAQLRRTEANYRGPAELCDVK